LIKNRELDLSNEVTYDLVVSKPGFLGGNSWNLKKLTPITVIFGKNGSGKSILLRQIRDKDPESNHYCVPERGGNISYEPGMIQQESDGKTRMSGSKQNLGGDYRTRVITRIGAYLTKRGAFRGQINDDDLAKIEKFMQEVLTDFRFRIQGNYPPYLLERIDTGEKVTDIQHLSSGEAQLLTLSLDLLLACELWKLDGKKGTLLVDEPDSHLHPDMQQRFAKFLTNLNQEYDYSIITATHSTTLLSALGQYGGTKTSVVYLDDKNEQHASPFGKVLKTMSTCLGGHALMGPLFSAPLLLVEGDDDYRIWSEIPRHGLLNMAVIPCCGEEIFEYQKILEKLFSSILEKTEKPNGYALLDGDKKQPQTNQNHIQFLRLSCHESENLYLTDEVLKILGYDLNSACQKIIQESDKFGQKAEELKTIDKWDRKTVDCKNVINQIAQILDSKNLHWAYRLGKVLGEKRPEGQLAEFLGTDVVNSIWGNHSQS
jgi:predicted ATPase